MVPDGQKAALEGTYTLEKAPMFLMDLERRFETIRAHLTAFARDHRRLSRLQRQSRWAQINDRVTALKTQVLSLAKNRGEGKELLNEIRAARRGVKPGPNGKLGFARIALVNHRILGVLQGWLERHSMLLTLLPTPLDFSDQLLGAVNRELHDRALTEALRPSNKRQKAVPVAETEDKDDMSDRFDSFLSSEQDESDEPREKGSDNA